MTSRSRLLPITMFGSMVLPQSGSVLKAHVATEGSVDAWHQVSHLNPCWWLRAILQQGPCRSPWSVLLPNTMVTSGPDLQLKAMSVSVALLHPESVYLSEVPVTIQGYVDVQDLGPYYCPRGPQCR